MSVSSLVRKLVPVGIRRFAWTSFKKTQSWPPRGAVRFGSLRRLTPIGEDWGFARGLPVDRWYIERFLRANAASIRGRVLEVDSNAYTIQFGGDRVTRSDVLHIAEMRPGITLVGDLTKGDDLPSDAFDCIILTQVLNLIYDPQAAIRTVHRMLKPGGTALVTVPGLSRMTASADFGWGHCWGFTTISAGRMVREAFEGGRVELEGHGNVLSTVAFMHGLAAEELDEEELAHRDPEFDFLITLVAVKAESPA